jgi:hypothetical protein
MKIDFEFQTKYGTFRDALYLQDDHTFTEAEIQAMKDMRLSNWIYAVENPPPPTPNTVEIDSVTYEKIELDGQIFLKPMENPPAPETVEV